MKISNRHILILVLIIGALLRFYNYFSIPYTHDEFSALFRLKFDNFSDLINLGVKIDAHPAGVHVFMYYWSLLFGTAEWVMKLPFTISGILSIYLIYAIGKKWYNDTVGLISAAFLASIQFTIMYSNIARPYISGMFLCLLMVLFWSNLVRDPDKKTYRNGIGFILSASLCAYNHHFSLLFAAIVGVSGVFFIKRTYLLKYLLSGLFIFILYIPHLDIFLYQLSIGGIESWLGKPESTFLLDFLKYLSNYSYLTMSITLGLILFGIYKTNRIQLKPMILFFIWFIVPFLIGYYYSVYVAAVIQFSVLIFSFPYIYFVLFGHISKQKPTFNLLLVTIILGVNIYATIITRNHYQLFYNSPYEQIVLDYNTSQTENKNTVAIIDSHIPISEYYLKKYHIDSNFVWFNSFEKESELITYLDSAVRYSEYLYFGCMSSNQPNTVPIIMDYYPELVYQHNYAGASTFLFKANKNLGKKTIASIDFNSNHQEKCWSPINEDAVFEVNNNNFYKLNPLSEFPFGFSINMTQITSETNGNISYSVKIKGDSIGDVFLVAEIASDDKTQYWKGTQMTATKGKWQTISNNINLNNLDIQNNNATVKIYFWNKDTSDLWIDDFKIEYSPNKTNSNIGKPILKVIAATNFDAPASNIKYEKENVSDNHAFLFNTTTEYGLSYEEDLSKILENENDFIDIAVQVKGFEPTDKIFIVSTLTSGDSTIYWNGTPFSNFYTPTSNNSTWFTTHQSIKFSDINLNFSDIKLKVYIWNQSKSAFEVNNMTIKQRKGNRIIYGIFEDFNNSEFK